MNRAAVQEPSDERTRIMDLILPNTVFLIKAFYYNLYLPDPWIYHGYPHYCLPITSTDLFWRLMVLPSVTVAVMFRVSALDHGLPLCPDRVTVLDHGLIFWRLLPYWSRHDVKKNWNEKAWFVVSIKIRCLKRIDRKGELKNILTNGMIPCSFSAKCTRVYVDLRSTRNIVML